MVFLTMEDEMRNAIVGKRILNVYIDEDCLVLETDQGLVTYGVYGDCCSSSYFNDFLGVGDMVGNIVNDLQPFHLEPEEIVTDDWNYIQFYGYSFTYLDPKWGKRTAVVSFRNESNGYYGGWMELFDSPPAVLPPLVVGNDWYGND